MTFNVQNRCTTADHQILYNYIKQWTDKWQMAFNIGNANFKLLPTTYIHSS